VSAYNVVADEYYIASRHPTCSNFRVASSIILQDWMSSLPTAGTICEVGAGRSVVAEQMLRVGRSLNCLLITDESSLMLAYSREFEAAGAILRVGAAEQLPVESAAMNSVVASLGDSYNNGRFWGEVERILKPGSIGVFTTPAFDWAVRFRTLQTSSDFMHADFELTDGTHVLLPSFIYSESEQLRMLENSGLRAVDVRTVTIADLGHLELSPKLCLESGRDIGVVTGYLFEKPQRD
jgi:ubiquinone/menaquinone biosynthesis C-methylase UbiE